MAEEASAGSEIMTTVVILQPSYLPWLGFFDQMQRSDIFVYYDDVQFDKHGWRNRNRIKSANGPLWLTVPVLTSGRQGQSILETEIDNRATWARKHIAAISQNYARAPYLSRYMPQLKALLEQEWRLLADLDIAVTELICEWFGIHRKVVRASELDVTGDQSTRLLNICKYFDANHYLSGNAAEDYLDQSLFLDAGISVELQSYGHPNYQQLHGDFVPFLSALDLILNTGSEAPSILKGNM